MDTVGEFLTRIRNASKSGHEKVDMPSSKMRVALSEIFLKNGMIRSYKVAKDSKQGVMRIYLKYDEAGASFISKIARVSIPGRRVYCSVDQIPRVKNGLGFVVVSTSKGVLTGGEAINKNIGGELLCRLS
jgi:small subunit ribosomal protein S8